MKIELSVLDDPPEFVLKSTNVKYEIKFDFPKDEETLFEILTSEYWPEAVDPTNIIETDWDKLIRAKSIINNLLPELDGKTLLCVGDCPKVVEVAKDRAKSADHIGINRMQSEALCKKYDIILLYDVLDHISTQKRLTLINIAKNMLAPDGLIVCRCHPWTSIHGGHCYHRLNKAYANMFLGYRLNEYQDISVDKIPNPVDYYDKFFQDCGLDIVKVDKLTDKIPEMIDQDDIIAYLSVKYDMVPSNLRSSMQIVFMDYCLKAPPILSGNNNVVTQ